MTNDRYDTDRAPPTARRRRGVGALAGLGSVPVRAGVGHRPGGLQRATATRGSSSRTTTPGRGCTGGTRTAWPGSATRRRPSAWPWRCGTASTRSSRSGCSGSTGPQGNHGEDVKEYWWYLDSTPTHSWMTLALPLPAAASSPTTTWSPRTRGRGKLSRSTSWSTPGSSTTTGTGSSPSTTPRPARPTCCMRITVENRGPDEATLHVLPTLWFRNTWAWGLPGQDAVPRICGRRRRDCVARASDVGPAAASPERRARRHPVAVRQRDQRRAAVRRPRALGVPEGRHQRPRRARRRRRSTRTGSAPRPRCTTRLDVPAGGTERAARAPQRRHDGRGARAGTQQRVRRGRSPPAGRRPTRSTPRSLPRGRTADEALVLRQALAGLLWGKQFFHYDVERWLDGDPAGRRRRPAAAHGPQRRLAAPQQRRRHLDAGPVGVPLVRRLGPGVPLRAAGPRRPGVRQEPARSCCCASGTCTPTARSPRTSGTSATSTRRCTPGRRCGCSRSTAARDFDFLARVFHKLLINFTWWVNRKDSRRQQRLRGRLPGAGQHRPDRPVGRCCRWPGVLEQSDGTAWMAMYALNLLEMALRAGRARPGLRGRRDEVLRALRYIADAAIRRQGLWDEEDGFFYDVLHLGRRHRVPMRVRSMVGLLPLCADDHARHRDPAARCPTSPSAADGSSRTGRRPARSWARRTCATAPRAGCCRWSAPERLDADPGHDARRGRSSCRRTACGRSRAAMPPEHPFVLELGGADRGRSTTSRPSRPPGCSAATPTGAGRSGSRSTPCSSRRCGDYARVLRRRPAGRVPDRVGDQAAPWREVADDLDARLVAHLPRRPDGRRPVLRRRTSCSSRPALARPLPVPRVLPRRHRRGSGREPPDRLDRAGRRPDPAPRVTAPVPDESERA